MNSTLDPIAQLRDIHLPNGVSWWPPAPAWWLLTILLIAVITILYWQWRKLREKYLRRRAALNELQRLEKIYQQPQHRKKVIQLLSVLLRRVAFIHHPRHEVAGLSGEAWLTFLNRTGETEAFASEVGKLLVTAPYNQNIPELGQDLFPIIEQWIEKNT